MLPAIVIDAARTAASRPAHVALAATAAGVACAAAAPRLASTLPVLASLAAAVLLAAARARGTPTRVRGPAASTRSGEVALLALLALAGGAAIGHARLASIDRFDARVHDGARLDARALMLAHPRPGPIGSSVEVEVMTGELRGARLLARIPPWAGTLDGTPIGAELRLRGRLKSLDRIAAEDHGREFKVAPWLRRRRVAGELLLNDAVIATGRRRGGLAGVLDRARDRAEAAVAAGLPADQAALLRGMVLGQDEAIDRTVRDEFRASGLGHILAVSGQNVMLLAALALPALTAAGLGAPGRAVALLALIALYVPLAGAGASLQRAGVMGVAGIAAMLAARPASRSYALLLAAVATLVVNPRAVGDPGWQLSFAAVAGILVIGRPLARSLKEAIEAAASPRAERAPGTRRCDAREGVRPRRGLATRAPRRSPPGARQRIGLATATRAGRAALRALADGVAITVAATLATAPLLAHHFGAISLASLPANVLALPMVAPAMWLGMLKAAVGQVALAGLPGDRVAALLGAVARAPLAVIAKLAERFADLPASQLHLALRSFAAVALAYGVLAVATFAARRAAPSLVAGSGMVGGRWRRLAPPTRLGIAVAIAAAIGLAAAAELRPPGVPRMLTLRFLDVGQGDATLIQHPDGTAMLFDGGPPEGGIVRELRRTGVRRLALVVATHPSRDHHGGLPAVLASFPVDTLLDGGDGTRDPTFRALEAEADRRGVRRIPAQAPLDLRAGDLRVQVLSPPPRPPGPPPEDPNPRATTAIVSAGDFDLLLSADAESPTLLTLPLPDVDAMKLPHHGSADPGLPELLRRVRPELAGITVGENTYGHPAPSTLGALRTAAVPTWRTDRDGTITVTVTSAGMRVETASR
jgi:competence protein ComEC